MTVSVLVKKVSGRETSVAPTLLGLRRSDLSVGDLAYAAIQGDRRGWTELVHRHERLVNSVARGYRLNDADSADVVQNTWLRALENIRHLQDPERFSAWLSTIARRECLHILRCNARQFPTDEELLAQEPDKSETAENQLLRQERRQSVHEAVRSLPPRQREFVQLLVTEPAPSYEHIGAKLGMPIGSIGPTRGRVLAQLRQHTGLQALAAA